MGATEKKDLFRMLILITSHKLADKASNLYLQDGIPVHYRLSGMGTASSEMLSILGIGSPEKSILLSLIQKDAADKCLIRLHRELHFGVPGNGLAFTLPLSGMNQQVLNMLRQHQQDSAKKAERKEDTMMTNEVKRVLIISVVNQGYSEEVMSAARAAGARGGTVLHSRQIGDKETLSLFGLSLQDEKEIVMIVANSEDKMPIMQAIGDKCGLRSEAKGIVLSLPIDSVIGLSN